MSNAMLDMQVDSLIARGHTLEDQGLFEPALAQYQAALAISPKSQRAFLNIGNALTLLGRTDEAEQSFLAATRISAFAPACLNLGNLYVLRGNQSSAIAQYREALRLRPGWDQAQLGLCNALFQARDADAEPQLRSLVEANPGLAKARSLLADVLANSKPMEALALLGSLQGQSDAHERAAKIHLNRLDQPAAVSEFRRALELDPLNQRLADSFAFYSLYCEDQSPADYRRVLEADSHRRYQVGNIGLKRRPSTRLRVGYISGDFISHALMHYAFTLFEQHDRAQFEVLAISSAECPDHVTSQLRERVDSWIDIADLSDADACAVIRDQQIDILIDLSGRSSANRLGVMALRAAPLQITAMGVLSSTFTPNVDYRIADRYTDPEGLTELWHSEKLLRMPDFHACYTQLREFASPGMLPAMHQGYLTFGYFNNALKITRPAMRDWAMILKEVPHSRLIVLGAQNDLIKHSIEKCLVLEHGIAAERITIRSRLSLPEVTQAMSKIDIAFDPYPYSGGITSIESLLAGVPFLTMSGSRPCSRNGLAILSQLGLQDWIAHSHADFVERAVRHAKDWPQLQSLRQSLPQRCRQSALMDARTFIREWESLLMHTWAAD